MDQPRVATDPARGPRGDAWQLLVDSASDAYVSIDASGVVTHWNLRAVELFGWERDEALGEQLSELIIPPEFRDAHLLGLQRFVATGRGEVAFQRLQLPALHRSGRRLDVEFTILPVEESGWHFHSFLRDVTAELAQQRYVRLLERVALAANEAQSIEAAMRASLQALQELTSSRLAHGYLVEDDGEPLLRPTGWWHPQRVEPLGSATAAATFTWGEGLPGRVAASGEPAWVRDVAGDDNFPRRDAALASGVRAAFAFPVLARDRTVAVIELFREHVGEPEPHLLEVMRSVGAQLGRVFEREQAFDELLRVAADREAIIAIVGHELRGPLAAAHAATGLLADGLGAEAGESELLGLLDRQLARLRRLVDMFLTAQRLEAGSLEVRARPVGLASLVHEVVTDGDFDVELSIDDAIRVQSDPDHVAQIVWNLLGNAVRHGTPPVTISAEIAYPCVDLVVADAGPGVPEDVRPRLFERFSRGTRSQGTGLGLSIVRGLARANGGDATYRDGDEPAFIVQLPVA